MAQFTELLTHEDAASMATFRLLYVRNQWAAGHRIKPLTQQCVGWRWHSLKYASRWYFTGSLMNRAYPPDAEFVPVWADCTLDAEVLSLGTERPLQLPAQPEALEAGDVHKEGPSEGNGGR